jgi:hypothetical protein
MTWNQRAAKASHSHAMAYSYIQVPYSSSDSAPCKKLGPEERGNASFSALPQHDVSAAILLRFGSNSFSPNNPACLLRVVELD